MVHLVREIYHHNYSWRDIKESQLGELYISMMLKTLGLSLVGIFVPVYLYQLGYELQIITLFFLMVYGIRLISDSVTAWLVGYFGPKHIMILSHIFLIITMYLLLSLQDNGWPLAMIALTDAMASGMFFVAYHIEFSKIQSQKSAGHQISLMYKLGKIAGATGPLIGGLVATIYSLQAAIILAIALIILSAIPLLISPEPVRLRQHITWRGFPFKQVKYDIFSNIGVAADQIISLFIWPLYVAVFLFSDDVYLDLGIVTSLGLVASFFIATLYGRMIDNNHGRKLLNFASLGVFVANLFKAIIPSGSIVYIHNLFADPFSIGVRMPFTKGLYSAASSYEGYRNAYIAVTMISTNLVRVLIFFVMYLLLSHTESRLSFQIVFVVSAFMSLMSMMQRFKVLR